MNDTLRKLAARYKEPSSWAGIGGILTLVGLNLDPGTLQSVSLILAGVAGVASVFIPEAPKPQA